MTTARCAPVRRRHVQWTANAQCVQRLTAYFRTCRSLRFRDSLFGDVFFNAIAMPHTFYVGKWSSARSEPTKYSLGFPSRRTSARCGFNGFFSCFTWKICIRFMTFYIVRKVERPLGLTLPCTSSTPRAETVNSCHGCPWIPSRVTWRVTELSEREIWRWNLWTALHTSRSRIIVGLFFRMIQN